jgi:hypothetical protein
MDFDVDLATREPLVEHLFPTASAGMTMVGR